MVLANNKSAPRVASHAKQLPGPQLVKWNKACNESVTAAGQPFGSNGRMTVNATLMEGFRRRNAFDDAGLMRGNNNDVPVHTTCRKSSTHRHARRNCSSGVTVYIALQYTSIGAYSKRRSRTQNPTTNALSLTCGHDVLWCYPCEPKAVDASKRLM